MSAVTIGYTTLEYDLATSTIEGLMLVSRRIVTLEIELQEHKAVLMDALATSVKHLEGIIWQLGKGEAEALVQAPIEF